jgi:colanic acid/amylovoran biosynthesis glycosyltransferase
MVEHEWDFLSSIGKTIDAAIVHSHFGNIGWQNQLAVEHIGARHVVTYYGYDLSLLPSQDKKWGDRYRRLFETADLFLCEGPHMRQQLMQLGCPGEKVIVHHLGVETNEIPFMPRSWTEGEPLCILIAASFQEKKGIPYAIRALAQFQEFVPIQITIIGDATIEHSSQEEKRHILETIAKCGLKPKTRLLGYQPYSRLFDEAYRHHLFISPSVTASDGSTEGGAPVTLIEMMATGMPVISTSHCDIPEVVQYGIEDWLVDERDTDGLVRRLLWLFERPTEWSNLLSRGRAHIEKNYNAFRQGVRLGKIYESLVNN